MSAITIDRTRRHGIRKLAAVFAGLLVLGTATLATVGAWDDSGRPAASSSYSATVFGQGSDATGHHFARFRV